MGGDPKVVYLLEDLLAARHEPPEWAFILEFSGGVESSHYGRRADAVAFNCWPSTGQHRLAFEIKRTRADFMREVDLPDKRAWLEKHFHQCYFVVVPDIVKLDEVPEGWGVLVATKDGKKLIRRKAAKHREVGELPENLALSAVRALSQKMVDYRHRHYVFEGETITQADVDAKVGDAVKVVQERTAADWEAVRKLHRKMNDRHAQLKAPFEELARAAGEYGVFGFGDERAPSVADVRRLLEKATQRSLSTILGSLRAAHTTIGNALQAADEAELQELKPEYPPKRQRFQPVVK